MHLLVAFLFDIVLTLKCYLLLRFHLQKALYLEMVKEGLELLWFNVKLKKYYCYCYFDECQFKQYFTVIRSVVNDVEVVVTYFKKYFKCCNLYSSIEKILLHFLRLIGLYTYFIYCSTERHVLMNLFMMSNIIFTRACLYC